MSNKPTRFQYNADGVLDDFCAWDVKSVHFEAMDQSQWFLGIEICGCGLNWHDGMGFW